MKVSMLASGSGGNATFIEENGVSFLVDAGLSCKKIEERLESIGRRASDLQALFITHEHSDHIAGAGILARKYDLPIYISPESFALCKTKLGKLSEDQIRLIQKDILLTENIYIKPFDVMHDAIRTLGFRVEMASKQTMAISTDIGHVTNLVREAFRDVNLAIVESNYDYHMLMSCSYPMDLKHRVKSRNGHLSNNDAAKFLKEIFHAKLQKIFLAHISKDSNQESIIHDTLEMEFEKYLRKPNYEIASQDKATGLFSLD